MKATVLALPPFAVVGALGLPLSASAGAAVIPEKRPNRPDFVDPDFWRVPRKISIHNANTDRQADLTYWRDGAYVMPAYFELCKVLGDHHDGGKSIQLDPRLFDLTFATQRWYRMATGKHTHTEMTSGYRTARTNVIVGGAPGGRHPSGQALDGALVGVPVGVYANMAWAFAAGGVGLYDRHVHMDVGREPLMWRGHYRES